MTALRRWFDGRSLRERRLILVAAALVSLLVVWAGIILPVTDGLSSAKTRYADATIRLGAAAAEVDALHLAQRARPEPLTGSLADVVRTEADRAGFTLAGLDDQGPDRVHVSIASARPGALTAWLARLEAIGVIVGDAQLTDHGDRTVAAQLTLRSRGR